MRKVSLRRLPVSLTPLLFGIAFLHEAHAATSITATITQISTQVTPGTANSRSNVPGAGSGTFPTGTNYTLNYNGQQLGISTFTTGVGANATTYRPIAYAGTITTTLVRSTGGATVGPNNNLLYHRQTAPRAGNTFTLGGPFQPIQQTAFNSNNLNIGTDNLFGNTGDGSGNNNNIERVDVVFRQGLTASDALAFAIFERGASNAHDGFGIAAITGIDASGTPTSFGTRISFASNSYGTSDLLPNTEDWLVIRNQTSSPGGNAQNPSTAITNQGIGGTTVAVTRAIGNLGLGISVGQTIFGYSLFGSDVTAQGNSLRNVNTGNFPKSTLSNTGAGGIDLIAYTGVAFNAVPEPATAGLVLLSLGAIAARRRRVHR